MSFGIFLTNLGTSVQRFSKVSPATQASVASTVAKKALQEAKGNNKVSKEKPQIASSTFVVASVISLFQACMARLRG